MSNELVQRGKDTPVSALQKLLTANSKQIEMATKSIRPERLIRLACTAVNTTPSLQNCNMLSICNSVMLSAQLGLEINNGLGHGWLIPYKGVCTFQPGYRGLIDLAFRAESIESIKPVVVYEGDEFDYQEGEDPHLVHKPVPPSKRTREGDDYAWIGAYSRCRLPDGMTDVLWMWREEIEDLRRKSSRAGNGPWDTWFWEMVKKTPIKRHMKYLRLSEDAGRAVGVDDQAEAFAAKDADKQQRRDEVAQDMILEASFVDQAMDADEKLARGTRDEQQAVAERKLAVAGKAPAPATEQPPIADGHIDPNATVTDERAEEVKDAMQAANWTRKQAEKLWSDLGVNNAYGLTNKKADLAMATIAGKEG